MKKVIHPTIGSFTLIKELGVGSFATVYLAEHDSTALKVAMKIFINIMEINDLVERKLIEQEIEIMKRVHHPLIADLYCCFEYEKCPIFIMELIEGVNMLEYVNRNGPIDENTAKMYFGQILLILEYLHYDKKIVHRDLKCENLMIDQSYNIHLIDFGFATSIESKSPKKVKFNNKTINTDSSLNDNNSTNNQYSSNNSPYYNGNGDQYINNNNNSNNSIYSNNNNSSTRYNSGNSQQFNEGDHLNKSDLQNMKENEFIFGNIKNCIKDENPQNNNSFCQTEFDVGAQNADSNILLQTTCGSLAYIAPEIICEQPYNASVDVWSLGCVLYAVTHGELPFGGPSDSTTVNNILRKEPKYDTKRFSMEFIDFLQQTLKKDPKERTSVADLVGHPWITNATRMKESRKEFFLSNACFRQLQDQEEAICCASSGKRLQLNPRAVMRINMTDSQIECMKKGIMNNFYENENRKNDYSVFEISNDSFTESNTESYAESSKDSNEEEFDDRNYNSVNEDSIESDRYNNMSRRNSKDDGIRDAYSLSILYRMANREVCIPILSEIAKMIFVPNFQNGPANLNTACSAGAIEYTQCRTMCRFQELPMMQRQKQNDAILESREQLPFLFGREKVQFTNQSNAANKAADFIKFSFPIALEKRDKKTRSRSIGHKPTTGGGAFTGRPRNILYRKTRIVTI